jgi:hypothetical protein
MEKITYLPNGQWLLEKSNKKESPFSFKHIYSDDVEDEESFGMSPGSNPENWQEESKWTINPVRTHWLEVNHKDKGRLGLMPIQTEIFQEGDNPSFDSYGYSSSTKDGVISKLMHSSQTAMSNEHAEEFLNNMKEHGLNYEDISRALIDHSIENVDPSSLHNNMKLAPLEYISKKPGQKLQ